ncbi:hypothetical protein OG21DRAFT_1488182 [Imleria badia]|nr:hypothetical protein OG21DRAFT_1488182 [Imleria badia]
MRNHSCFISTSDPDPDSDLEPTDEPGVVVDSAWTFAEVNNKVHEWFPQVFAYLDAVSVKKSGKWSVRPEWYLIVRSPSRFKIVETAEPNGSTLFVNRGCSKATISDSMLWFATRKPIPDDVYDSWNKETNLGVSGSESEIESPGKDDKRDPDDIISVHDTDSQGGDSDTMEFKLTSSMMDLKLYGDSDSGVVSKDKGKGKARSTDQVTPPINTRSLRSPIQSPPAIKKFRDVSSRPIPLFIKSSPPPQISSAPASVPVNETDVLLRRHHYPDSPNAPRIIHPWSSDYAFMPYRDFHSYIFCSRS